MLYRHVLWLFDFVALSFSPQVYPVGSFSNMDSFLPAKEWILHVVWFFGSKTISIKDSTKNIWLDYFAWESSDDWFFPQFGNRWFDYFFLKTLMIYIYIYDSHFTGPGPINCVRCIMDSLDFFEASKNRSIHRPPTSDCVWWPITPAGEQRHEENLSYPRTGGPTRPGKHTKSYGKIHHFEWENPLFRLGHVQ